MSRSDDKLWFVSEIDRVEEECGKGRKPGRTSRQLLDTAGDALPDSFYDIINTTFRNYHRRVLEYINSEPNMAYPFLVAHAEIFKNFDFGDYREMARKINDHILRTKELDLRISPSPRTQTNQTPPPAASPLSGPPTPCTVDYTVDLWREKVAAHTESPSQHIEPLHETHPCETTEINSHDRVSPVKHSERAPTTSNHNATANSAPQVTSAPPVQHSRRARYPRAAKVTSESPVAAQRRTTGTTGINASVEAVTRPARHTKRTPLDSSKRKRPRKEVISNKRRK